jgi:uncharacterized protein (TIGR03435 family)
MSRFAFWCLTAFAGSVAFAQSSPAAFDVASIRPIQPGSKDGRGGPLTHRVHATPGNVIMREAGLDEVIMWAYDIEHYQIAGPSWLSSARFDITAKADGQPSEAQMRVMMQNLLANRFALKQHREDKELACAALLVGKDGPKLKASEDQGESTFDGGKNGRPTVTLSRVSMHEFAAALSEPMRKPVIDMTGLKGTYTFTLDASNYVPPPPAPGQPREQEDESYMVMRALQDQLGLRIENRKISISMLVVDHAGKVPTEN